jgi:hypothetical protein
VGHAHSVGLHRVALAVVVVADVACEEGQGSILGFKEKKLSHKMAILMLILFNLRGKSNRNIAFLFMKISFFPAENSSKS